MISLKHVWIVDDELPVVKVTCALLESVGEFVVQSFTSPEELLKQFVPGLVSCVVSDLAMPEIDGMELQRRLHLLDSHVSVVVLSGKADIPTAVKLMQGGALTVLEKPYRADELIEIVIAAVQRCEIAREVWKEINDTRERLERLTEEERNVLDCLVTGLSNKEIAYKLSMSPRTVDRRRQSLFVAMGVNAVVELVAKVERLRARNTDWPHDVNAPHLLKHRPDSTPEPEIQSQSNKSD